MRVLDIDMDFFLEDIAYLKNNCFDRVDSNEYKTWKYDDIEYFLKNNLKLSKVKKIEGKVIENHNQALYYWQELINHNKLTIPFEVIHIDAHADLGLSNDLQCEFIFDKLLKLDVEERRIL